MQEQRSTPESPDKRLAAVCGLFCEACSWYIATTEDPERLERLAAQFGTTVERCRCHGCGSDQRLAYCANCVMFACAAERGIDFCGECADYPCEELTRFQAAMPHRIELWANHERIVTVGWKRWMVEKREHYACPRCGTLNSAYDAACRKCGEIPSCGYVAEHRQAIEAFVRNR